VIVAILFAVDVASHVPSHRCVNLVTQAYVTRCEYQRFQQADRTMNTQWKITLAKMREADREAQDPRSVPPGYADALIAAQRTWLAYRDAQCRIEGYDDRGGTAEPMRVYACKTAMTVARTKELRDLWKYY
jgi:uncharacterized protein YecT (DUF1311 family)